jgi:polar amino acid transport system ATP-binding protein
MTNAGRPIVKLQSVTKRFGAHTILDRFDLSIAEGERLAVIGRSGSGKSTLLRVLMTLENIQEGDVVIDGDFLWRDGGGASALVKGEKLRLIRGKVGMVFQQFNLFPHMTALRNVAEAPFRQLKLSKDEAYQRARDLLAIVGLRDKGDFYPIQLSGGQQQRVAIARALAMRPKLLLFDEVTSALDPELVGEVLNVIRDLPKTHPCTMIMVTHQMGFAREFADRVCFVENGVIVEQGSPAVIFQSPSHERTRAFLSAVLDA